MRLKTGLAGIATAALVTFAPFAAADEIIGNFGAGVGTGTAFGAGSTTQFKAFGFTMGSTAYFLDSAVLSMTFNTRPARRRWCRSGPMRAARPAPSFSCSTPPEG